MRQSSESKHGLPYEICGVGTAAPEGTIAPNAVCSIALRLPEGRICVSIKPKTLLINVDPTNVCTRLPWKKHSRGPAGVSCVVVVARRQSIGCSKGDDDRESTHVTTILPLTIHIRPDRTRYPIAARRRHTTSSRHGSIFPRSCSSA